MVLQNPDNYYRFTFDNATIRWGDSLNFQWAPPVTFGMTFGVSTLYVICIFVIFPVLCAILKKTFGVAFLKQVEKLHYTLLFLYSTFAFLAIFQYIIQTGEFFNFKAFLCNPLPPSIRLVSLTFTASKIWEWWDSFIHVQNDKGPWEMGFLHTYHHATTFFLFLLINNFPATEKSGMLMNGFIHALMYYHFAYRLPRFMRPVMTILQILQLGSSTWLWGVTPATCADDPELSTFQEAHPLEFWLPYSMAPVYLIFFIQFFVREYFLKKKPSGTTKPKGD